LSPVRKPFPAETLGETPMRRPVPVVMSVHFPDGDEAELVKRAAAKLGLTPSAFLRSVALEKAQVVADGWDVAKMKRRIVDMASLMKDTPVRPKPKLKVIDGGKK